MMAWSMVEAPSFSDTYVMFEVEMDTEALEGQLDSYHDGGNVAGVCNHTQ